MHCWVIRRQDELGGVRKHLQVSEEVRRCQKESGGITRSKKECECLRRGLDKSGGVRNGKGPSGGVRWCQNSQEESIRVNKSWDE